jgi:uncharacterized protein
MKRIYVIDSGPLISYFNKTQVDHRLAVNWFAENAPGNQLLCTEAVVTEVAYMLGRVHVRLQLQFLAWAEKNLTFVPVPQAAYLSLIEWMHGYSNVPMDFADATVLWVYEQNPTSKILTHDMRGFGVFRLPNSKHLKNKFPQVVEL